MPKQQVILKSYMISHHTVSGCYLLLSHVNAYAAGTSKRDHFSLSL